MFWRRFPCIYQVFSVFRDEKRISVSFLNALFSLFLISHFVLPAYGTDKSCAGHTDREGQHQSGNHQEQYAVGTGKRNAHACQAGTSQRTVRNVQKYAD